MALPTGQISLSQVNTELGLSSNSQISMGSTAVRALAVRPSGSVSMSNLLGRSATPPGPTYAFGVYSTSVNEGGTVTFVVNTANVANGTNLSWAVSRFSDINEPTGTFSISSNTGTFTLTATADLLTEGSEAFTVNIYAGQTIVLTSAAITINDTSTTPPIPATTIAWDGAFNGIPNFEIYGGYNTVTVNFQSTGAIQFAQGGYGDSAILATSYCFPQVAGAGQDYDLYVLGSSFFPNNGTGGYSFNGVYYNISNSISGWVPINDGLSVQFYSPDKFSTQFISGYFFIRKRSTGAYIYSTFYSSVAGYDY